jgi:peptidyl-prolyl cis-trans isomerase C
MDVEPSASNSRHPVRAWPWLGMLLLTSQLASAGSEPNAVTVGGVGVGLAEVQRAVEDCRARALAPLSESELARCVNEGPAFAWLLSRSEAATKARSSLGFKAAERDVLSSALLEAVATQAAARQPVPASSLAAAAATLNRPERVRIFRILVADEAAARGAIERLGSVVTPSSFRAVCREVSLDKATAERGGDLGFVAANGSTDVPEVAADPALFDAARSLADGELLRTPVAEGQRFAVVWRRGHLPAIVAPDERVHALAEASWQRQVGQTANDSLVAELRKRGVREFHADRLELLRGAGRMFPLH